MKEIRRKVDGFPSRLTAPSPTRRSRSLLHDPPEPRLQAVRQDREGRLWVMVQVAGKEWRKGVIAGASGHDGRVVDWNAYYDTVIEVIDPDTGRLLQTTRLPLAFNAFVDDDLISTVVLDEAAVPHLTIWRLRLLQP